MILQPEQIQALQRRWATVAGTKRSKDEFWDDIGNLLETLAEYGRLYKAACEANEKLLHQRRVLLSASESLVEVLSSRPSRQLMELDGIPSLDNVLSLFQSAIAEAKKHDPE